MNAYDEKAFQLISFSGTAKSFAMEALRESKKGYDQKANQLMEDAREQMMFAHQIQDELLNEYDHQNVNILMVHAQDHLMIALTVIDLVSEMLV